MKSKLNASVLTFVATLGFFALWRAIGPQVSSAVFLLLDAPHVFPRLTIYLIALLLPLIVLVEVVTKLLLMRSLPDTLVFEPIQLETVPYVDIEALNVYTRYLEALGFTKLYDSQLAGSVSCVARLFSHSEHRCFADVSQLVGRTPMICSVVSTLEQDWTLSTTDRPTDQISATAYAFLRQPRRLGMYKPGAETQQLLQSHLTFRHQMMADLHLQVLPDVSLEAFLEIGQRGLTGQKQALWRKSILLGLVERLLFSLNPKTEWLGEYADLAARRQRN